MLQELHDVLLEPFQKLTDIMLKEVILHGTGNCNVDQKRI